MTNRAMLLYGTEKSEPEIRLLKAGVITAEFVNGNLAAIAYGGTEILRAISFLVRDEDWGTYAPKLSGLNIAESDVRFEVRYSASCEGPRATRLIFRATISGEGDRLTFDVAATPDTDFITNRCGLCVLHPIEGLAGSPVTVEHTDGRIVETLLPDLIDPWQPFKNMRAITHEVRAGVRAQCRMEGDIFEMEDQRNWSDASYKTYVRPLELPWPYMLKKGEELRQTVTLTIAGQAGKAAASSRPKVVKLTSGPGTGVMPGIGMFVAPEDLAASLNQVPLLTAIKPAGLLLQFDPLAGHGTEALAGFAALQRASAIPATLELALPCMRDPATELAEIAGQARETGLDLVALVVSPSVDRQSTPPGSKWPDCPPLEDIYAGARRAFPKLKLGGGMLSYFTELNRKRVPAHHLDFVTHATNPIVHAADDRSVMQTLEALPFITRSVRAIHGDMPYHIGPSTIAMRQNPYGNATKDNPHLDRIPMANRDPRHNGLFAAAWAVGYVVRCLPAQSSLITLSALAGDFGLIAGEGEPVVQGGMRPLYHVVEALAQMGGAAWTECHSSDPGRMLGLTVEHPQRGCLSMIANLTPSPQMADLSALGANAGARIAMLDAQSLGACKMSQADFGGQTLQLDSYAVAFLRQPSRS